MAPIKIHPNRISFAIHPPPKKEPKPTLKEGKHWFNTTLEEYSDFIFAHGRYNNLENLDNRIGDSLEIPDPIKDDHASDSHDHPFGKGTHPGNLLIGMLMEIYRSTYHCRTSLEALLDRAENIPSIMKDTSAT